MNNKCRRFYSFTAKNQIEKICRGNILNYETMIAGIFKTSEKENEKRIPILPEHLKFIPDFYRPQLYFEEGYGNDYGISDHQIHGLGFNTLAREELFAKCNMLILPKPLRSDFDKMNEGQIHWGWPHCVQQTDITQIAIEKRLTLIAWEAMHIWGDKGDKLSHLFYKNNELAGYTAVLHALQLLGIDGLYGPRRKVVIMGYGSVSKGAIRALQGRGFNNIEVFTKRPLHKVSDQNPDVYYNQYIVDTDKNVLARNFEGKTRMISDVFADADIIINGILQDTDNPVMFINISEISKLKENSVIIDISCDEGMAFPFARPTSFICPIFTIDRNITYYSVDHTPSYLWKAASRELSRVVLPFLSEILGGSDLWYSNPIIKHAIEIENGKILNPKILSFQKRSPNPPYNFL